jgi:hypothetical protein
MFRIPEEVFAHHILNCLDLSETVTLLSSANGLFQEIRNRRLNFQVTSADLKKSASFEIATEN